MRAVKRSPLFRIALLSLAVLFAHSGRATNVRTIIPLKPPCPRKVAAAQPDSQRKLIPGTRRVAKSGERDSRYSLFGGLFVSTPALASGLSYRRATGQFRFSSSTVCIAPQRLPFALRI